MHGRVAIPFTNRCIGTVIQSPLHHLCPSLQHALHERRLQFTSRDGVDIRTVLESSGCGVCVFVLEGLEEGHVGVGKTVILGVCKGRAADEEEADEDEDGMLPSEEFVHDHADVDGAGLGL